MIPDVHLGMERCPDCKVLEEAFKIDAVYTEA